MGSFGAVFPGSREGARVVPRPALRVLSSRHKPGNSGAVFATVLVAVLGPARPAGTGPGGPKTDIDCYRGPDTANAGHQRFSFLDPGQSQPTSKPLLVAVRVRHALTAEKRSEAHLVATLALPVTGHRHTWASGATRP